MNWPEALEAFREAEKTVSLADDCATKMAKIVKGSLRKVWDHNTLKSLKKELAQYNAHTGQWKEDA